MAANGGELLVRTLIGAGVRDAFVLHGGHLDPIFQACLDHGLHLVDTRHEAAAGHAADAYARQTGQVGVCMITAGPGFTNAITAITQAYLDASPVFFVIGAAPLRDAERWPLQGGIDQVGMVRPITKWAAQATRTDQIPHLAAHALRVARAGRPGPVLLEIPIDVLFTPCEEEVRVPPVPAIAAPAPAAGQVEALLELLAHAARPVLVAGGGVLHSRAGVALRGLAEDLGVPVFANNKALGVLPWDHTLSGHALSNLFALGATEANAPDLAIFFGARLGMFTRGEKILNARCKLVQVDLDAAEFNRLRTTDLGVQADCLETATALRAALAGRRFPDWSNWAARVHQASRWHEHAYAAAESRTPSAVHPYVAVREIVAALPPDAIVCADGGEASQWAELASRPRAAGQFSGHGYLGCLGIGMPFAIGAQVAHPDRRVVCVVGDGAAGLNIQEFDTMVRHNLPIVTVVLNNKAWGMCVHGQQAMYGANRLVVTQLGDARYEQVAEGFGCHGAFVTAATDVRAAVATALATQRPACVNVIVDVDTAFGSPAAAAARQDAVQARAEETGDIAMPYYEKLKR
jgi:acetolactate synthase-1/2/3 large subunit